jgi:hypothetical protein
MGRRVHGIELDLDDPATVPQIDEDEATQVAAAMHPAVQVHLASDLVGSDRAGGRASGQAHPAPNI